jgi:hypothetical protein
LNPVSFSCLWEAVIFAVFNIPAARKSSGKYTLFEKRLICRARQKKPDTPPCSQNNLGIVANKSI